MRRESRRRTAGCSARLERAAQTVAVLKGLGYAGAYIGGTHDAGRSRGSSGARRSWRRGWEALVERLRIRQPRRVLSVRGAAAAAARRCRSSPVAPGCDGPDAAGALGEAAEGHLAAAADSGALRVGGPRAGWTALVERVESSVKRPVFGCEACGNCVLGHMEYVCPQTCPKQMRNGPCGGTFLGQLRGRGQAVHLGEGDGTGRGRRRVDALKIYIPPPDRRLKGTSSWINYFLERDSRPAASYSDSAPSPPATPARPVTPRT